MNTENPFGVLGSANLNKTISELERARNNLKTLRGELPTTSAGYQIIDAAIFDIEKAIKGVKKNIWATIMEGETE